ncbi:MAG TPA: hypothetical protein VGH28_13245 [Polyangiaceae bacterium]
MGVAVVACGFHVGGETNGAHGNGTFSYASCLLGCDTTTPMMLNDEEDVSVAGSIPASVSVESSAPSVVAVKSASRVCCEKDADAGSCRTLALNDACAAGETASLTVKVDAAAAGSGDLAIKASDGSVWDSVTLSVEPAASLALACNTPTSVTLAPNTTCAVTWKATDASGRGLMSTAGIQLTTSDPAVASFNGFLSTDQSSIVATPQLFGDVSIHARAAGDAVVTGSGGGATETLAVHVTP